MTRKTVAKKRKMTFKKPPFASGKIIKKTDDPKVAMSECLKVYRKSIKYLRNEFKVFCQKSVAQKVTAYYPYIEVQIDQRTPIDSRRAYGFISVPGVYRITVTRPDLYGRYYTRQLELLRENNHASFEIGISDTPIPIHFALGEDTHLEGMVNPQRLQLLPNVFDLPDLDLMDDNIVNGTYPPQADGRKPLALFTAPRVDLSLQRLRHYTATNPEHFQNYVIFTNYQFYVDQFVKIAHGLMKKSKAKKKKDEASPYVAFVEPGNVITHNKNLTDAPDSGQPVKRLPQMPAYHLKRDDHSGITLVNIGVGPSNAKTITDHIAVLRPHAWMMLGHCAGLRNSQSLGDYALAHAYLREDHVLDNDLPLSIPLPALSEIQVALAQAVAEVSGLSDYELKKIMRTGTVATIDDRNWELRDNRHAVRRLSQSRAIALDMESATIAANGFRFRVPYGTLLCVSDKPLHGQLKLPGMADDFYRQRVEQHLQIGIRAMELLRKVGLARLHSRKLRSFNEVAFQ